MYLRYADDQLVEELNFIEITERYYAKDFKYVIGRVNLNQIFDHKDRITSDGAFIAVI